MANPVNAAQMRRLLELADIQRLAQDLNIECGIPRAFFVGKESAGKTTIMERLMGGAKVWTACVRCREGAMRHVHRCSD